MRKRPRKPKGADKFAKVPLWWAEQAAKATRTQKAMTWIWLLYLAWAGGRKTFRVPNARLADRGVSRWAKAHALRELEAAGLIRVDRDKGKAPTITLLHL